MESGEHELNFEMQVPSELEGGVYANFLTIWHTGHEFTLDFSATQLPRTVDTDDPTSPVTVPCRVVSRVKIPPSLVFDVIRAINENMTRYEAAFGNIQKPGDPQEGEA